MIECFNYSTVNVKYPNAVKIAIKGQNMPVKIFQMANNELNLNTENWIIGKYAVQFYDINNNIIGDDFLIVNQNLLYAPQDYDFRSQNEIALQAINAYIHGTANAKQRKVKVGDKEIEYCSLTELLAFKYYLEKEVRKQQGKPQTIKHEVVYFRSR